MNRASFIGEKFGYLTVLELDTIKSTKRRTFFICQCDCGNKKTSRSDVLSISNTISCGCKNKEQRQIHKGNFKHGYCSAKSKTGEYAIWSGILTRCLNPNRKTYKYYGGRGITVCDRWKNSFEHFLQDMGNRPSNKHSIDRIDVNGNYEPANCRWVTSREQYRNKSNNYWIEYNGERLILSDWAVKFNITASMLYTFLKTNSIETAYNRHIHGIKRYSNSRRVIDASTNEIFISAEHVAEKLKIRGGRFRYWLNNPSVNKTNYKWLS